MARIIGNLSPQDDYTHPLGSEPNFNESMYFNFFDARQALGGFVRLGNRANEGYAERTVTLYLPDGRVLFGFERARISDNERMDAGGLRFEVIEPTERLRTVFSGDLLELREPREMADPRKAWRDNPTKPVSLDLVHTAAGPLYGSAGNRDEEKRSAEEQFAKAHYEQHMHVGGRIQIGDEELAIDAWGLRDHSWGPRHWQAIEGYEWLTMNFGSEIGAMISVIRRGDGPARTHGVLIRGEQLDAVTEARIEAEYEDNGLYHRALSVALRTSRDESFQVTGRVLGFIPLRNRRAGLTTHIGEGMTEWRLGDRVGYGLSEFLRQVS